MSDDDNSLFDENEKSDASEEEEFEGALSESEDDMDEELKLPENLNGISNLEKQELLRFKKTHTEIEWEEELMRRIGLLSKKVDMERLKKMTAAGKKQEVEVVSRRSTRTAPKSKQEQAREKLVKQRDEMLKRQNIQSMDVEEDEDAASSAEAEEDEESEDEGADDDLFGDDEMDMISSGKHVGLKKTSNEETAGASSNVKKKALKRKDSDSEDEDGKDEEDSRKSKIPRNEVSKLVDDAPRSNDVYGPRADLEAYRKIQMRRLYVEKWIQEPYFDSMCKGCFIRVYIGLVDNVAVYRMCEVVGLMPYKKTYKLPGTNIVTDKVFLVSIGSNQTTVKIHLVSNSRLVETELQFYDRELKNQNKIAISLKEAELRYEKLKKTISGHQYTDEEITSMVKAKTGDNKAVTSNLTDAKISYTKKLEAARAVSDFDLMEKYQKLLDKVNRDVELSNKAYTSGTNAVFSNINRRNKERNVQMDMESGIRRRQNEQEKLSKGSDSAQIDPFQRRETRPTILWVTGKQKTESDAAAKKAEPPKEVETSMLSKSKINDGNIASLPASTVQEIIKTVCDRLAINPAELTMTKKQRYLNSISKNLKNKVRSGISLSQYLDRVTKQQI